MTNNLAVNIARNLPLSSAARQYRNDSGRWVVQLDRERLCAALRAEGCFVRLSDPGLDQAAEVINARLARFNR